MRISRQPRRIPYTTDAAFVLTKSTENHGLNRIEEKSYSEFPRYLEMVKIGVKNQGALSEDVHLATPLHQS
jgi:hypothetical protein